MSMISGKCDELRKMADKLETYGGYGNIVSELRYAADLILELRNGWQQANAENAKLVDVLHEVETEAVYAYHCLQQDCVTTANSSEHFFKKWWHAECEIDQLKTDNAKLREVVRDYERCMHANCDRCEHYGTTSTHCPLSPCFPDIDDLRETGVEAGE